MTAPLITKWDGEAFWPLKRFAAQCDKDFVVDAFYRIEVVDEATVKSRGHYFATLKEIWLSLPESQASRWPTPEHFRKHCLIETGWRNERILPLPSLAVAQRVAGFMRAADEYSIVVVRQLPGAKEATLIEWTAKSQAARAMDRKKFNASKQAVLDYAASLIGITPSDIPEHEAA